MIKKDFWYYTEKPTWKSRWKREIKPLLKFIAQELLTLAVVIVIPILVIFILYSL